MDTYFDMLPSELILIIMTYLRGESIRITYINTIHDGLYKSFINNVMKGFCELETIFSSVNIDTHQFDLIFNSIKNNNVHYPLIDIKGVEIVRESLDQIIYNIITKKIYCNCIYSFNYDTNYLVIIYADESKFYYFKKRGFSCVEHIRFDTPRELFIFLSPEVLNFMLMQQGYKVGSIKSILPRAKVINGVSRNKWMKENKWELYPKFRYINFNKN